MSQHASMQMFRSGDDSRIDDMSWPTAPGAYGLAAEARARRSDPATSHDAAASVTGLTQKQIAVLAVLTTRGPLTDEELIEAYGSASWPPNVAYAVRPEQSESGIRTRRNELVRAGLVRAVSEGKTRGGRKCMVWGAA